jgi:membrane protein
MPNTKVNFKAAFIGGLAGGFIWATLGVAFATFVSFSTRTQLIYSGFAVAILTLIWLYLNWIVLLFGAQLAYYIQNPAFLRIGRREPRLSNSMRERLALNVMLYVGRAFRDTEVSIDAQEISSQMRIPSITLAPVLEALEAGGLLAVTDKDYLLPGKDMAKITLEDILSVVRIHGETGSYRDPEWSEEVDALGTQLDNAVLKTVGSRTLVDLVGAD